MKFHKLVIGVAAAAMLTGPALAGSHSKTTLRVQTHYAKDHPTGIIYQEWENDVETMSGGSLDIEMFWASSVVGSVETFDAAANGILDCDMTGGAYQTGKNPAFQFTGDLMGGYSNPYQQMSWMLHGGGRSAINDLYNAHNMEFVGWWIPGPE